MQNNQDELTEERIYEKVKKYINLFLYQPPEIPFSYTRNICFVLLFGRSFRGDIHSMLIIFKIIFYSLYFKSEF